VVKTYTPRETDIERRWWVIDAEGLILGRLATQVASILRGKHKAQFTPHADTGDYVVVVNAGKVAVTGNRLAQKMYYRHSGYPGGLRSETLQEMLAKHPDRAIRLAVKGMLPRGRLGRQMYGKLKVYAGPDHPHAAQGPRPLVLGTMSLAELTSREDKEG
jgi:large subunit ribosomal protein L13